MNKEQIKREIKFRADRSSGSGGQHVNKVATKVTMSFIPANSLAFTDEEKNRIIYRLKNKLNKDGALVISEQSHRSQFKNRKLALEKLILALEKAALPPLPPRKKIIKKTNTASSRLAKKRHSEKKANRRKIKIHDVS